MKKKTIITLSALLITTWVTYFGYKLPIITESIAQHFRNSEIQFVEQAKAKSDNTIQDLKDKIALEIEYKEKLEQCKIKNQNKEYKNCRWIRKVIDKPKTETGTTEIITDFNLISEPIIEQKEHKDILLICGHWKSQNWKWDDNWASFWDKTEREYILEYAKTIKWFDTFWCWEFRNNIQEKLEYIKSHNYSKVIELHFDKRAKWENVTIWTKILYANKNGNNQENQNFANELCWKLNTCKTHNSRWLLLLNSSSVPAAIIEIADPNQPWFKRWKIQVRNMLNNL